MASSKMLATTGDVDGEQNERSPSHKVERQQERQRELRVSTLERPPGARSHVGHRPCCRRPREHAQTSDARSARFRRASMK